ncbi:hypothetical protein BH09GEM1_BH09GEM1_39120 [soil metagenome]
MINRRDFLQAASTQIAAAAIAPALLRDAVACAEAVEPRRRSDDVIDRRARLARHSPVVRVFDSYSALSVGNGAFAFTVDATGLQTFADEYHDIPLATQAEWGWHSYPNPAGYRIEQTLALYDAHGRQVSYDSQQNSPAGKWLRENPHRLSLARVGFVLTHADGSAVKSSQLSDVEQRLDLWTGTIQSRFTVDGKQVRVTTIVHPGRDAIVVRVESDGLDPSRVAVRIAFPYGGVTHTGDPADWSNPDRHRTEIARSERGAIDIHRTLDAAEYFARAAWSDGAALRRTGPHELRIEPAAGSSAMEFTLEFASQSPGTPLPGGKAIREASVAHWNAFWTDGATLDLTGSTDSRSTELERRIVLSEYLTAIQCAGTMPPQETGETFNSWFGKSHLEMHWWHAAHFALWNRSPMLERSLPWYSKILPEARAIAVRQGYRGVRWPKMVGPAGHDSPSGVGPFLIWQQPHPIYLAELVYRAHPNRATLDRYREIVFESAEFIASYPFWDEATNRYVLGPPLIPAQESHPPATTFNPTFELAYWAFGLETAQRWRRRLGMKREPTWDKVLNGLSALPMRGGLYVNTESAPTTFTDPAQRRDHPTLLGAYGFVASPRVDRAAMRRTLRKVVDTWDWADTWGWDYPLVAMTAARVGEPELAIDALMMNTPKNHYHPNGHNFQRAGLSIYLPGNGGLLSAVAMMAAGWDGAPAQHAPGFPTAGWTVREERLRGLP